MVYTYQFRFGVLSRDKHNGLRLGLPLKCFSRHSRGFAGLVRVILVSTIISPFHFLFMLLRCNPSLNPLCLPLSKTSNLGCQA